MKNHAFTLIEVLIAILIIAVLTAIALPKYQLLVDKAEFRKIQATLETVMQSVQRYMLINNSFPRSLNNLDISFEGCTITDYNNDDYSSIALCNNSTELGLEPVYNAVYITLPKASNTQFMLEGYMVPHGYGRGRGTRVCSARQGEPRYIKLCASVGKQSGDSVWKSYDLF